MRWPTMVVASLILGSASLAQDVPDVVVTGERLKVSPGLWRIRQLPGRGLSTITANGRSTRQLWASQGWERQACIPAAALEDAIRRLLQEEADRTTSFGCSRFRIRIGEGRIDARRSCTFSRGAERVLTYNGTLRPERLDARMVSRVTDHNGEYLSEMDARLVGERIGECPRAPRPAPSLAAPTVPAPAGGATPVPALEEPVDAGPAPSPVSPGGTAETSPNDVLVVARRLRKLRLHYSSSGGALRWCHADISSGDKRIDRIGCAIVRACVREGFEEQVAALQCFDRKVDLVDAAARP